MVASCLRALSICLAVLSVALAPAAPAQFTKGPDLDAALISNGTLLLAVKPTGNLGVYGEGDNHFGFYSLTYPVAMMRDLRTGAEATDKTNEGEGWGAAYNGVVTGWVNPGDTTATGVTAVSFTTGGTGVDGVLGDSARSLTRVGSLEVLHDFHPHATVDEVYEVTVTLTNPTGAAMSDVQYRRGINYAPARNIWDGSWMSIDTFPPGAPAPSALVDSNNFYGGMSKLDPLSPSYTFFPGWTFQGPPLGTGTYDWGRFDQGALFDLDFGTLPAGASKTFTVFLGAAPNVGGVMADLAAINADVFAYAKPYNYPDDAPGDGGPSAFFIALEGIEAIPVPQPPLADFLSVFGAAAPLPDPDPSDSFVPCGDGRMHFTDLSSDPDGDIVAWAWDFGDGTASAAPSPVHDYAAPGDYLVTLTVTDAAGNTATQSAWVTVPLPESCQAPDASEPQGGGSGAPGDGIDDEAAGGHQDGDGVQDRDDRCVQDTDEGQEDLDGDGQGDACDRDDDNDGAEDVLDPCPRTHQSDFGDLDADGSADACDPDQDGDGLANAKDICPRSPDPGQDDLDGDGVGDACSADRDGDGVPDILDAHPGDPLRWNVDSHAPAASSRARQDAAAAPAQRHDALPAALPWAVGGVAVLALLAIALLERRRRSS